jgi:hypothetical protein
MTALKRIDLKWANGFDQTLTSTQRPLGASPKGFTIGVAGKNIVLDVAFIQKWF